MLDASQTDPLLAAVTGRLGMTSQAKPVSELGRTEMSKVPGSAFKAKSPRIAHSAGRGARHEGRARRRGYRATQGVFERMY